MRSQARNQLQADRKLHLCDLLFGPEDGNDIFLQNIG
jgi:hypothetical protein